MHSVYFTVDFQPLQPTGCVAFTSAYNSNQARKKLRQAIIDPGDEFEVKRLPPRRELRDQRVVCDQEAALAFVEDLQQDRPWARRCARKLLNLPT